MYFHTHFTNAFARQSKDLSDRVALLEEGGGGSNKDDAAHSSHASNQEVSFAKDMPSVRGIAERPPQDADYGDSVTQRMALLEQRLDDYDDEKDGQILNDEDEYNLSESTFSLLITEYPLSIPFGFAVSSVALSVICLTLTLASSIFKGTKGNRLGEHIMCTFLLYCANVISILCCTVSNASILVYSIGMPAGVTNLVRVAQFFGKSSASSFDIFFLVTSLHTIYELIFQAQLWVRFKGSSFRRS